MSKEKDSAGHTKGPWSITPGDSCLFVYDAAGTEIASVGDSPYWKRFTSEHEANARLIAAAPDLLAAAQLGLKHAESWIHDQLDGTGMVESALAELEPIRAALSRASKE